MPYPSKNLYASHDWRGEKAPSILDAGVEWATVVPSIPNKVVVLVFWATWCQIPLLNEIHKNFTEDVVVIGLTDENPDKVKNWLTNRNVEYYIGVDADAKYRNQIGIQGTPNVLVIDKEGVVQWQGVPDSDPKDPLNEEVIKKIVALGKLPKLPPAKFLPITETLIAAAQPNIEQLKNLGVVGIKSVLNLRTNEEAGVIPNEEFLLQSPIEYAQIPILYLSDIDESNIDTILSKISSLPKPCLVHCNVGLCAVAAVLLAVAEEEKKNGNEISKTQLLEWGAGLSFNLTDQPKFYDFLGRRLKQ